MRSRARWSSVVAATAATVVTVGAVLTSTHDHQPPRGGSLATTSAVSSPATRALAVLRAWDHRRALAWAEADLDGLARLYLPASAAGQRDVAMLNAYRDRGLRVTGMTRQVVRLRVVSVTPGHLRVVVTDRLVGARLVGAGVRAAVPDGRLATREVRLARVGGRWQVAEVTGTEVSAGADHPAR